MRKSLSFKVVALLVETELELNFERAEAVYGFPDPCESMRGREIDLLVQSRKL